MAAAFTPLIYLLLSSLLSLSLPFISPFPFSLPLLFLLYLSLCSSNFFSNYIKSRLTILMIFLQNHLCVILNLLHIFHLVTNFCFYILKLSSPVFIECFPPIIWLNVKFLFIDFRIDAMDVLLLFFFFFCYWNRILCGPGWPQSHSTRSSLSVLVSFLSTWHQLESH